MTRAGIGPTVLTIGTRANAATDEFWRDDQRGRGQARGPAPGADPGGGGLPRRQRRRLRHVRRGQQPGGQEADRDEGPPCTTRTRRSLDKSIAWGVTSMAPYVMMPERLLKSTLGTLAPVGEVAGATKALRRGDKTARGAGGAGRGRHPGLDHPGPPYDQGHLTGAPPEDANERRRMEAQGVQWETVELPGGVKAPLRYFGSSGRAPAPSPRSSTPPRRPSEAGADPGAVWEARGDELVRWTLEESYLSDLVGFGDDGRVAGRAVPPQARSPASPPGSWPPSPGS